MRCYLSDLAVTREPRKNSWGSVFSPSEMTATAQMTFGSRSASLEVAAALWIMDRLLYIAFGFLAAMCDVNFIFYPSVDERTRSADGMVS